MKTNNAEPFILLVEDDIELAQLTKNYLNKSGYKVDIVSDGNDAVNAILQLQPDLLILDIMLPNKDGIDICREIRNRFAQPILMLTARSDNFDQILGLEIGADDYVCKPVEPRLLLARIKALLRRVINEKVSNQDVLNIDGLKIDRGTRRVQLPNVDVELNTQEFELLWYLISNVGKVLSRNDIFNHVRGFEYDGTSRFVDITISHLRSKLDDDITNPQRIKTVFGKGYLFCSSQQERSGLFRKSEF